MDFFVDIRLFTKKVFLCVMFTGEALKIYP